MASRICWYCEKDAHQTPIGEPRFASNGRWYLPYRCDACRVLSIGSASLPGLVDGQATAALPKLNAHGAAVEWQPVRMVGRRFDDVPSPIDAAASEAWACYSIGQYRSSVLMARAVVEATAKQQEIRTGNLMAKIDALYKAETIGKGVKEAAHEIRFMGNEMAHGDFVTDIGEDECADVLTFLEEFLNEVYQRSARLTAFREQRLARRAAASTTDRDH